MKKFFVKYIKVLIISCCIAVTPKLFYGYECTISGTIYNVENENYESNHLVTVNFLDTTLIDSLYTNHDGYFEKTYQIGNAANKNIFYNFEVKTQDPCNSDFVYTYTLKTYAGTLENLDFDVCKNYEYCVADFDWYEVSKNTVQFVDYSYSWYDIKSWFWNFGDGETSTDQNPVHEFSEAGYHNVTLSIMSEDSCEATTSSIIYVTKEKTIEGMVYASGYPLPDGRIYAYTLQLADGLYELALNTSFKVDSGYFSIPYLYLEPSLLYVIPEFNLGDFYYPMYFPTYYHNEANDSAYYWEYSDSYSQNSDSLAIISLVKYDSIFYGPGTINGTIDLGNYELSNAQEICVLLLNNKKKPVKYTLASNNNFELYNIPYGNYYLLVDIVGIPAKLRPISLSINNPEKWVNFTISEDTLTNISPAIESNSLAISPNPFTNQVSLHANYSLKGKSELRIYNISGQLIYAETIQPYNLNRTINLTQLPEGSYIATLINNGMVYTQKLIKLKN